MKKFSEIEYARPNLETFIEEGLSIIENIKSANSVETQKEFIYNFNTLYTNFDDIAIVAYIRHSINTLDEYYATEVDWVYDILPEMALLSQKYYAAILNSSFKVALEKELGTRLFTIANLKIKQISEDIVEDKRKESKLCSEYTKLKASAKIDWKGEELNLSQLAAYQLSDDRTIRKQAFDATFNFLDENSKRLDSLFDELVQLRDKMAKKLGFSNYIELGYYQMLRSDYTPEKVSKFREDIRNLIVPLVEKLYRKQASRLALDNLKHYDIGVKFKTGNAKPKGSNKQIIEKAQKMYSELSVETNEFFGKLVKYQFMDLETRKGKISGGYCTFLPSMGLPFVFSNSNGTYRDIKVLTHEVGHAFQKYQSKHFKIREYYWASKEVAEIHSMSMEFFTLPWMELFFGKETVKYTFQHLAGTIEFLPYAAIVDEFQHSLYEQPNMTPKERNTLWRALEMKYRPSLDYDGNTFAEEGGRWQQQTHIYNNPFYYIDYALAQICALQFWVKMQDNFEGAWKDYLKLCNAGGSMSFLKLLDLANLKSPFEDGVIEEVAKKVEAYLDNIDDSKL